jgi:hypothetical protein
MRLKSLILATLLLTTSVGSTAQAYADEAALSDEAVRLGHEGLALYEAAQWESALQRFEQASRRAFSPVLLLYMARCHGNVGRLQEAARLLARLASYPLAVDAPVPWVSAVRDARAELGSLRARVPSLRVSGTEVLRVSVDGKPAALGERIELDPGIHSVAAELTSGRIVQRQVALVEGQQDLPVVFEPRVGPLSRTRQQAPKLRDDVGRRPSAYRRAAWLTGGAGLAAAIVGSVVGVMASSRTSSLRSRCEGNACPRELQPDAERARDLANVSTAAFGIAGVNAVFSVTFLLLPE